ncbi:hypothetical protein BD770DRAFT_472718 [Pilaira anomala]|nr:hypothetical protein BD770DRAFT_472718 [Pilaira anomala]
MRTSIALAIVAATAVVAKDCNPSYNVAPSTECFTGCNEKAGSSIVPGWTMDHTSEKFLDSLKLMCTKTTAEYTQFMTTAGMCMIACAGDDPELFNKEFAGACAWYAEHKNDKCAEETTTTTTAAAGTSTTASASETTTTTVDPTVSSVVAAASSAVSAVQSAASAVSSVASAASSIIAASNSANPSASPSDVTSAASKMQMSGVAMALVAGAGYLAL